MRVGTLWDSHAVQVSLLSLFFFSHRPKSAKAPVKDTSLSKTTQRQQTHGDSVWRRSCSLLLSLEYVCCNLGICLLQSCEVCIVYYLNQEDKQKSRKGNYMTMYVKTLTTAIYSSMLNLQPVSDIHWLILYHTSSEKQKLSQSLYEMSW